MGDINNDGLLDFFISSYYGCRYNDIYLQKKDHSFELVSWEAGIHEMRRDQDGLWFDFDNDGKLDLLANGRLLKNSSEDIGNYVFIQLESSLDNSYAVGAKVIVYVGDQKMTRELSIGHGQKMQTSYKLHFGIGNHVKIDSVHVIWSNQKGKSTTYSQLDANNSYLLKDDGSISSPWLQGEKISVYPNPFSNVITVNHNWGDQKPEFTIQNEIGQKIHILNSTRNGSIYQLYFGESLTNSNYILTVTHRGKSESFKLIRFKK